MRKWTTTIAVAVLALALASVAFAKFTQVANVTLTAHKGGQSTGIKADVHSSDATAQGQKPRSSTKLVISFPAGTKFNLGTGLRRTCTLSDKQLSNEFGPACPSKSLIGTGSANVNAMPITPAPDGRIRAYIAGANKLVLVLTPTLNAYKSQITVIRGTVSGSTLTIPIPQAMIGADKKTSFPGVSAVLTGLKLSVPAVGSGRSALVTAGRCTAHKFVVKSHFAYRGHSSVDVQSSSGCNYSTPPAADPYAIYPKTKVWQGATRINEYDTLREYDRRRGDRKKNAARVVVLQRRARFLRERVKTVAYWSHPADWTTKNRGARWQGLNRIVRGG